MLHVKNPRTAQDTAHRHQHDPGRQHTKTKTVRTEQPHKAPRKSVSRLRATQTHSRQEVSTFYTLEDPRLQAFLSVAGWTCIFVSIFCLLVGCDQLPSHSVVKIHSCLNTRREGTGLHSCSSTECVPRASTT